MNMIEICPIWRKKNVFFVVSSQDGHYKKLVSVYTISSFKSVLIKCIDCIIYQFSSVSAQLVVDVNDSTEGTAHSLAQGDVGICSSN